MAGAELEAAVERRVDDAVALASPIWLGMALSLAGAALLRESTIADNARLYLDLLDRHPGWERAGSIIASSVGGVCAHALAYTDPASAVAVATTAMRRADHVGAVTNVVTCVGIAALAAARLGEADAAAALLGHSLATAPVETPGDSWVAREVVAELAGMAGAVPTARALSRADLFATLSDLQQRHPAPDLTGEGEV